MRLPAFRRPSVPRRGVSLVEALVAMAVMSIGMLAVVGVQGTMRLNSDLARQRTEATRIASEEIERVRSFTSLGVVAGTPGVSYDEIVSRDVAGYQLPGDTANTSYQVQRTVRRSDGTVTLAPTQAPEDLKVDAQQLTNTFGPEYRMLLIGAGQLTEYMATMALFNGFAVTVCDPREEYRGSWSVPGATVVSDMPDDVVLAFKPDRRTCVVALTHDPKLDDLALLEALNTEAFYVGGIGSRRNNEARRARMIEHFDQTEASLQRLRGPIGIYIGSKTPPEIAVSVMAEILAVKNGVTLPRDMEVAQAKNDRELAHNDPGALVCGVR